MENFMFITEQDKSDAAYAACVGGMALSGAAFGRLVGLKGLVVGGVGGAVYGLLSCRTLAEPIKAKLFSSTAKLTDGEIAAALRAIRLQHPSVSKSDALRQLAAIRSEVARNPMKYRGV
jgi:hypothetical protein